MAKPSVSLIANYDDFSDVLYVASEIPVESVRYRDGAEGLLLRVNLDGRVVGVTVEDFHYRWQSRLDDLISTIAAQMSIDAERVGAAIPR